MNPLSPHPTLPHHVLLLLLLSLIVLPPSCLSYPEYLKRLPNGAQLPELGIVHLDVNGGGQLNQFGKDFVLHGAPPPSSRAAFL